MRSRNSTSAGRFVEDLLAHGRYVFTRTEAQRCIAASPSAVYMALHRLATAGRLVMPRSGFYVIVDPQHRASRSLPPEWFVRDLMRYMRHLYYVGLLSAAQLHGAAHHRPLEFQVVIPNPTMRPVKCGNVQIRFFGKGPFDRAEAVEVKTPTGSMAVSSPETTAWDLVRYPKAAGGLDNVMTVLSELSEKLDAVRLAGTVRKHGDRLVAQRLGYLLDRLGHRDLTKRLAGWIDGAPQRLLNPSAPVGRAPLSRKWNLIVNARPEPEA